MADDVSLMTCPNCGQSNRLRVAGNRKRIFRCGRCGHQLSSPSQASFSWYSIAAVIAVLGLTGVGHVLFDMYREADFVADPTVRAEIVLSGHTTIDAKRYPSGYPNGCFKGELRLGPEIPGTGKTPTQRPLLAPFGYIDPRGAHWDVPAGFPTDGASIPEAFHRIIGDKWTRRYLRAAVIHDYYIRRECEYPDPVHKVFHHALLASETPENLARRMYVAVKHFGPNWGKGPSWFDVARGCGLWKGRVKNDEMIAFFKKLDAAEREAFRQMKEREAREAALPPEKRYRSRNVSTEADLAEVLSEALKSTMTDQADCVTGPDGRIDCPIADQRDRQR